MNRNMWTGLAALACAVAVYAAIQLSARAHCDTMAGPLIPEAKAALESGDIMPVLKWVGKKDEAEIRAAFDKAVAVRSKGPEARELADTYFLETLVRVHRAGEGAPFTGLKDEPVDPAAAMADKALSAGSPDEMIGAISNHMAKEIRSKYNAAAEALKHKDESVEKGREFVRTYVIYVHYVEGIHAAIASAGGHMHKEDDVAK